jgi:hypothetical protein
MVAPGRVIVVVAGNNVECRVTCGDTLPDELSSVMVLVDENTPAGQGI